MASILRRHVEGWTARVPQPPYHLRNPLIAEAGPRKARDAIRKLKPASTAGEKVTVASDKSGRNIGSDDVLQSNRFLSARSILWTLVPRYSKPRIPSTFISIYTYTRATRISLMNISGTNQTKAQSWGQVQRTHVFPVCHK